MILTNSLKLRCEGGSEKTIEILIDTHYVIRSAVDPGLMERWARELIEDLNNSIFVSAASIYEISLKVRHGKLPGAAKFESDIIVNLEDQLGCTILPLEPESMMRAARLPMCMPTRSIA